MNTRKNLVTMLCAVAVAAMAVMVLTLGVHLGRSLAAGTPTPPNWPWRGVVMQQKTHNPASPEYTASTPADIELYHQYLGINSVHLYLSLAKYCAWKYGDNDPSNCDAAQTWTDLVAGDQNHESWLDTMLDECRTLGITAIVTLNSVPLVDNSGYYDIHTQDFWENTDGHSLDQLYSVVSNLAAHIHAYNENYAGKPVLYAYDIIGEPTEIPPGGTAEQPEGWPGIQEQIVQTIRAADTVNPPAWAVVKPGPYGGRQGYANGFQPLTDEDLVYSIHVYDPHVYTHQHINGRYQEMGLPWPGTFNSAEHGGPTYYDEAEVLTDLAPVKAFVDQPTPGNTPFYMYVGEFSAALWACNAKRWLHDMVDIWNNQMVPSWGWAYFSEYGYPGWSPQYTYTVSPATVPETTFPTITFSAPVPTSHLMTTRAIDLGAMFGKNPYPRSEGLCDPGS